MKKNKVKYLFVLLCLLLSSLNIYAKNTLDSIPPLKIVYNYNKIIDAKDTNLNIDIRRNDSTYYINIKYKETMLRCNVSYKYVNCSDSILILLNGYNKKSNKVLVGYYTPNYKFNFLRVLHNVNLLPFHEVIFYFNNEVGLYIDRITIGEELNSFEKWYYNKIYEPLIDRWIYRRNEKYMEKHFGVIRDIDGQRYRYSAAGNW